MIHSKYHKQGFTFVEVLLAISIASVVLVPVFTLQGRVIKQIVSFTDRLQGLFYGQSFFNEQRLEVLINKDDGPVRTQKEIKMPELTLTYERKKGADGSSLSLLNSVYLEQTTIAWTDIQGPQEELLVSCVFLPGTKS